MQRRLAIGENRDGTVDGVRSRQRGTKGEGCANTPGGAAACSVARCVTGAEVREMPAPDVRWGNKGDKGKAPSRTEYRIAPTLVEDTYVGSEGEEFAQATHKWRPMDVPCTCSDDSFILPPSPLPLLSPLVPWAPPRPIVLSILSRHSPIKRRGLFLPPPLLLLSSWHSPICRYLFENPPRSRRCCGRELSERKISRKLVRVNLSGRNVFLNTALR